MTEREKAIAPCNPHLWRKADQAQTNMVRLLSRSFSAKKLCKRHRRCRYWAFEFRKRLDLAIRL